MRRIPKTGPPSNEIPVAHKPCTTPTMLPYPTDRRRLLMMVRSFVHDFADFVGTRWHPDTKYTADEDDPELPLQEYLEQLAVSAADDDDGVTEMFGVQETEAEIMQSLQQHLGELLRHASWNDDRVSLN